MARFGSGLKWACWDTTLAVSKEALTYDYSIDINGLGWIGRQNLRTILEWYRCLHLRVLQTEWTFTPKIAPLSFCINCHTYQMAPYCTISWLPDSLIDSIRNQMGSTIYKVNYIDK